METGATKQNELNASAAFSAQAPIFDKIYGTDLIVAYKRKRVRDHVQALIKQHANILELNAGTGEDAVYFARAGHSVHATDISEGMQEQLSIKIKNVGLTQKISTEICSYTSLDLLQQKGPYDLIFSNFAGLNCTNELEKIFQSFDKLLNPQGIITMVLLPSFCLWETLLIFKGKFKTATRRFFSNKGRAAKVNDVPFICWYHNPKTVIHLLEKKYDLIGFEGLCSIVPPSYIEHFGEKHPKLFSYLTKKENKYKGSWPWKYIGDYYIISFQKKPQ